MSSRPDARQRERSWEREDREDRYARGSGSTGTRGARSRPYRDEPRRRSSRSRSPRRDRDSDRRGGYDRRDRDRDYRRDRDDDDRRNGRNDRDRGERRGDEDKRRERDDNTRPPPNRNLRDGSIRDTQEAESKDRLPPRAGPSEPRKSPVPHSRPNLDPDTADHVGEDGEAMEDGNDAHGVDAAIMAMMGVAAFGSTKGKHVVGNQEGAVNIKKTRTWRQYMNRRGGFNRPLDKIK